MNIRTFRIMKSVLIMGVMLFLICLAYAQQVGDIRTTGVATTGSATNWQKWNGAAWVALGQSPSSLSPISANVAFRHAVTVDANLEINGAITNPNLSPLTVNSGKTFTVGGSYQLSLLTVNTGGRFVNNGTVTAVGNSADIQLKDGTTPNSGGILENNGTITMNGNLNVGSYARIVSGPNGVIGGTGQMKAKDEGAGFTIANPGGYTAAIQLSGRLNVKNPCFIFNGGSNQVTGDLPEPIYFLTVASGTKLTLSEDLDIVPDTQAPKPDPFVKVESGGTLDTGNFIIKATKTHPLCDAEFILEPGATIMTSNVNGISSVKDNGNGRIAAGAIQTNFATYSSEANYVFYGNSTNQFSGCFDTSLTANTVNDLIILNPNGLRLCPNFQPLTVTGNYQGTVNGSPGYVYRPTLPVTLSYFNAVFNGINSVMMQWETQSETDNLGFYVLRSIEPQPAGATVVSELIAATNSSQGAFYCFEDKSIYEDGCYYYWLQDVSFSGGVELHGPAMVNVILNTGSNQVPDIPLKSSFIRNYPNPFNPSTQLEYYLENGTDVDFEVYNLRGQLVDQFTLRNQNSGFHRYTWKPELGSGAYLIRFTADGRSNSRKVILSK